MKRFVSVLLALGLGLTQSSGASAQAAPQDVPPAPGPLDQTQQVGGWTVADTGARPGDDSERDVRLERAVEGVELVLHRVDHDGVGLWMKFSRCEGLNLSSGFSLDGDMPAHLAQTRAEIHDAFKDFAKGCPPKAGEEAALMDGFDAADRLLETWVHDRPFTYPPDPPDSSVH